MEKETALEVFRFQTIEYRNEIAINKPKQYISKIIMDKMKEQKISIRKFEQLGQSQNYKTKMSIAGLYGITNHELNYSIDNLLKILELLDLELEIIPRR